MPGPVKRFVKRLRVPVTAEQERYLQFRSVSVNESVAAVVRHMIEKERKEAEARAG